MNDAIEKLEKKIEELKERADRSLGLRASYGRGYKGTTDRLLQSARNYEAQARELQTVVDELKEELS